VKLVDLPRPIPLSLYEETREVVRKTYAKIPGVVDVIEYGTIPHPGISDMDFIVVIEPGAHVDIPSLRTYTEDQQYAMSHTHFVISSTALPHIRLLDPFIVNFTPLLGRTNHTIDTLEPLSDEELRAFALEYPFVSWILPWLKFFAEVECLQKLPCRYFLEGIKLLPYCFRELHRAGLIDQPVDKNADCFRSLASEWFDLPENDLLDRVHEALEKNRESIKLYLKILSKGLKAAHHSHSIIYNFDSDVYIFEKDRTEVDIDFTQTHSPFTSQTYTRVIHKIPIEFSAPLNRLLFEAGHVPDFVRSKITTNLTDLPVITHHILEKRTQLINQTIDDVKHVRGGKLLGQTYGYRIHARPDGGSIRAKIGGMYDRLMERYAGTPFGGILKHKHLHVTL